VTFDVAYVIDAANRGMRNPSRNSNFILESFDQAFIPSGFVRKELEGYRLAKREIVGSVDLTHASPSQQGNNPVTPCEQPAREEAAFT
jgi:hypothetical protein